MLLLYPQTHPTVAHGHDTSSPPQRHALCGLRSTKSTSFLHTALHCIEKSTPHPSARTAQGGRVRPRLHPNSLLQLCLDDSITRRPDSQSATELSADRRSGRITVQSSRGGEVEVSGGMIRFSEPFETHAGTAASKSPLIRACSEPNSCQGNSNARARRVAVVSYMQPQQLQPSAPPATPFHTLL